jgi:aspartate aminotransferase
MISNLVKSLSPSKTLALTEKLAQMRKEGKEVIAFNLGEPDFNTPEHIINAGKKAMDDGHTKYTSVAGVLPLRQAICEKLKCDNDIFYKPSQICVSTGAKQALINALTVVCNSDDEVILFTPCWVSYVEMVKIVHAKSTFVEATEENGFQPTELSLINAINTKTKAILINSPNNPTGAIYSEKTLRMIERIAKKHKLIIISDEIYEKLIYSDEKFISFASLSEYAKENTIVINGFSKAYAMTGWRIGYTASPPILAKGIASLQSHTTSNANTISQYAAIEALNGSRITLDEMMEKFDKRREYLYNRLNNIEGITCVNAMGAFYLMPNINDYFGKKTKDGKSVNDAIDLCDYLLAEAGLVFVPGDAFFAPSNIRISYSNSMDNIKKGMDLLEDALKNLI